MTIDLEKLVPMPEPVSVLLSSKNYFSEHQMAALREQVAREVAKRCAVVVMQYPYWVGTQAKSEISGAIAAEFGLEGV
jgi:hypothetical protein